MTVEAALVADDVDYFGPGFAKAAREWRDQRERAEGRRQQLRAQRPPWPDAAGEPVDMPTPPERAPPIGEPFTPKLFPIERWKDIAFDLNEEWLVDGVIPKRGVGVIFGASQSFKSFVAMHMSLCAARKLSWASRPVEFAPVVYIGAEGYEAIWLREAAKIGAEPPTAIEFALVAAAPNLGRTDGDLPALIATIDSIGVVPGLVIVDTAAKVMSGADENNQGAAALLCNGEALSRHYGCFVLLVHHTGWGDDAQKRTRGWSGLPFGLDLIMLCERKQGDLSVTMTIQKLKDDELRERFVAKLERVELGKTKTGREISTLIVDSVTQIENAPAVATGVNSKPPTSENAAQGHRRRGDRRGRRDAVGHQPDHPRGLRRHHPRAVLRRHRGAGSGRRPEEGRLASESGVQPADQSHARRRNSQGAQNSGSEGALVRMIQHFREAAKPRHQVVSVSRVSSVETSRSSHCLARLSRPAVLPLFSAALRGTETTKRHVSNSSRGQKRDKRRDGPPSIGAGSCLDVSAEGVRMPFERPSHARAFKRTTQEGTLAASQWADPLLARHCPPPVFNRFPADAKIRGF